MLIISKKSMDAVGCVKTKIACGTFVEEKISFLDNVFVESIFCFPSNSVIDFSAVNHVGENLFFLLNGKKDKALCLLLR